MGLLTSAGPLLLSYIAAMGPSPPLILYDHTSDEIVVVGCLLVAIVVYDT
jgi:hypothetical protein